MPEDIKSKDNQVIIENLLYFKIEQNIGKQWLKGMENNVGLMILPNIRKCTMRLKAITNHINSKIVYAR